MNNKESFIKIKIQPMSTNKAYRGRRFKTDSYKKYEFAVKCCMPKRITIPDGPLRINYIFGMSSQLADVDNPIKPLQDILQSRFGFNDKRVFFIQAEKIIVAKGEEFIAFHIEPYAECCI